MANNPTPKIYWDSNCFIAYLAAEPGRHDACAAVIRAAERGDVELCTSYISLVETVAIPSLNDVAAEAAIAQFFDSDYIAKMPVDSNAAQYARTLRRAINLRGLDAIHLATAIIAGADALHTYDRDLLRIDCQALALPIAIEPPQPPQAIPQQT